MSVTSDDLIVLSFSASSAIEIIDELRAVAISYFRRSDGDDWINPPDIGDAARHLQESCKLLADSATEFLGHQDALRYLRLANVPHAKPITISGRHSTSWHEAADGECRAMLSLLGRMFPGGRIADIDQFLRGFRHVLEWPGENHDHGIPEYRAVLDGIALEHDRAARWLIDDGKAQAAISIGRGSPVAALGIIDQRKAKPAQADRQSSAAETNSSRNAERDKFIVQRRDAGDSWKDVCRAVKERFGASLSVDGIRKAYQRASRD